MVADCSIRPLICRPAGAKEPQWVRYHTYLNFLRVHFLRVHFGHPSVPNALIRSNKERGTIVPQDAEWRILAEEAAQENDPKNFIEIIEALTRALDQQQHKKKAVSASPRAQPKGEYHSASFEGMEPFLCIPPIAARDCWHGKEAYQKR